MLVGMIYLAYLAARNIFTPSSSWCLISINMAEGNMIPAVATASGAASSGGGLM